MEEYILQNTKLSLPTFVSVYSNLRKLQLTTGSFSFEDLQQCLTSSPDMSQVSPLEINIYSNLFIDACSLGLNNPVSFFMPRDILANESLFLNNLMNLLLGKCKGNLFPLIEEFRNDMIKYINCTSMNFHEGSFNPSPPQVLNNPMKSNIPSPPALTPLAMPAIMNGTNPRPKISSALPPYIHYDKSDPMVRFLGKNIYLSAIHLCYLFNYIFVSSFT